MGASLSDNLEDDTPIAPNNGSLPIFSDSNTSLSEPQKDASPINTDKNNIEDTSATLQEENISVLDPVSWLKSTDADPNFIIHVENVMNGTYTPIHLHTKISIIISGYLKSINKIKSIIPKEIEMLCLEYLQQIVMVNDNMDNLKLKDNVNNIWSAETAEKVKCRANNRWTIRGPKHTILTVTGDLCQQITNHYKGGMIILNVLGDFKGCVYCRKGGNIFVKCRNYEAGEGIIKHGYHGNSKYYEDDENWNDTDIHKYDNMMFVCDDNISIRWRKLRTRNTTTTQRTVESNDRVLGQLKKYNKMRIVSNKNLFGNLYINAGNEVDISDNSTLDSGSIYIVCNKLSSEWRGWIRAGRGGKDDLILHVPHNCVHRAVKFYPEPTIYKRS